MYHRFGSESSDLINRALVKAILSLLPPLAMSRKSSSCLHGPRPVSSRRSSSGTIDSQESSEGSSSPSNHAKDTTWPMSSTSSLTSQSSSFALSDGYHEPINPNTSDAELNHKLPIRQLPRQGARALPPIPRYIHRPSLSLDISSSRDSTRQARPRWLPVPPLPMTSFPTSKHRNCSTSLSGYLTSRPI